MNIHNFGTDYETDSRDSIPLISPIAGIGGLLKRQGRSRACAQVDFAFI